MKNADKKRVLVITSNNEHAKAAIHSLNSFGIEEITVMENSLLAIERLKTSAYDIVLCDQDAKIISGWLFIKEVKVSAELPNIPVLLFGKSPQPESDESLQEYGVIKYLKSPFTSSNLDFLIHSTLSLSTTSGTLESKYTRAKLSCLENQLEEAAGLFYELKNLTKNSTRSLMGLVQIYERQEKMEAVDAMLNQIALGACDTPSRVFLQIRSYLKTDRPDEAYQTSRAFLGEVPSIFYYSKVAKLFLENNKFDSAQAFAREAIEKDYLLVDFHIYLTKCHYASGDMERALSCIEEARQKFGPNGELFNLRGVCLKKLGKYKEALLAYEDAFRLQPSDPKIFFNMAMCAIGMRDYEAAARHLDTCLKMAPQFPKAQDKLDEIKSYSEKSRGLKAS
jgi:tetratricopeptide (TPR) repeat protein